VGVIPELLASAELYVPSLLVPVPVVTGLRFDQASVATGSSYSVNFSGPNLSDEMFPMSALSLRGVTILPSS